MHFFSKRSAGKTITATNFIMQIRLALNKSLFRTVPEYKIKLNRVTEIQKQLNKFEVLRNPHNEKLATPLQTYPGGVYLLTVPKM